MHIDAIDKFQNFLTLKRDWDSVYKADPEAQFFLSWTWMSRWLKIVDCQSYWVILGAKLHADTSAYVAFFPLRFRIRRSECDGSIHNEIAMAGNRAADYTGFICAPDFQDDAITAFAEYLKRLRWTTLHLEFICASDERIRHLLTHFPQPPFATTEIEDTNKLDNINLCRCPFVKLPRDWEAYLDHDLSANTRQKIRRLLRKVDNSGEFRITHTTGETVERDLAILLDFWVSKWGSRKGNSADSMRKIYRTMLVHCFERGALFLPILWKGEMPLAALALLLDVEKRSVRFYVGGRDATVNTPPPGFMLHAYSIDTPFSEASPPTIFYEVTNLINIRLVRENVVSGILSW
jgi:hypothetical protein